MEGIPVIDATASSVVEALEQLGLNYELMDCDPAFADTAAFCGRYGVDPRDSANTILVASRKPPGHYALCVVLATTRLDVNKVVKRRLGVQKVSFATAEQTIAITGMEIGGVTPFGVDPGIPVWVDSAVMSRPEVVLGAGSRSFKIRAAPQVLESLPATEVVVGLAQPVPDAVS